MAEDEDDTVQAARPHLVERARDAGRGRADEEQPAVRGSPVHADHGVEHVVIAAPRAHADLRDELMPRPEPQFRADAAAVHSRMEAIEIGARVDNLDLVRGHVGGDQAALDRLADGHDGGDAPVGIAETVPAVEGKADPAVEDEHGKLHEEAGEQGERARLALLAVDDVESARADQSGQRDGRGQVHLAAHRDGRVRDARRGALLGPDRARPRAHHHLVSPRVEPPGQVPELDGRPGEVVGLGIELQDPQGLAHPS